MTILDLALPGNSLTFANSQGTNATRFYRAGEPVKGSEGEREQTVNSENKGFGR